MAEAVKVIVRCRPINEREERLKCEVIIGMDSSIAQVQLQKPKTAQAPPKLFTFDGVYFMEDTTQQIYEDICFPLVEGVLEGYNGTVFAYGQTGCGKSYTMMGVEDPIENKGIIPRAFEHIFDHVAVAEGVKYLINASYLEIYNEEVRDLLGKDVKKRLELHEHPEKGVYVQGLSLHKVLNVRDLARVMELGSKNRSVGATLMNVDSSRSHSIFTIDLEMMENEGGEDGKEKLRAGRLNLVDLAGSERQSKTGSTGDRLKEATKINLSLSALGNVISALVDGRSKHIPYRDSKLTRLLQSSLGGNTKTLMVACISPADNNYDETLSTLRYANRAKNIKNKPRINEDPKDALLREYREEIEKLKQMLLGQLPNNLQGLPASAQAPTEDQLRDLEEEKQAIRREYEQKIAELKSQFSQEQADKTRLEEELQKLQQTKNAQLAAVEERYVPVTDVHPPLDGTTSSTTAPTLTGKGGDRQVLMEHAQALQRLEELQKEMIGGERAADMTLKQQLGDRRHRAEERSLALKHANDFLDDDGIMEKIFNSLTDEVRVKTHLLDRTQTKLKSVEEDVKDISAEFELDRQDYLDTIRNQERTIKLQQQLLETIVPCLRRDCNYYNLDKVRTECVWDEAKSQWILPKLVVSKPNLAPVNSKTGLLDKRNLSSSRLQKLGAVPNDVQTKGASIPNGSAHPNPTVQLSTYEPPPEEDKYFLHLQKSSEPDYFKPKRAMELLSQGALVKEKASPETSVRHGSTGSLPVYAANAAVVHGVGGVIMSESGYSRRPGRLQSLPVNPSIPQNLSPLPEDILDKVEKRLSHRRWNSLEPLQDKLKKPPL